MYPFAARAAVITFAGAREEEWRRGLENLNLVLSTTSVEFLSESDLLEILAKIHAAQATS